MRAIDSASATLLATVTPWASKEGSRVTTMFG